MIEWLGDENRSLTLNNGALPILGARKVTEDAYGLNTNSLS
jgi:hypothetical protein